MRIASHYGRLVLVDKGAILDVEKASSGRFSADPQAIFDDWSAFRRWAETAPPVDSPLTDKALEACVPRPRQVFAIGLNYKKHAMEGGHPLPENPAVFTKFPSCLSGPFDEIPLTGNQIDWELELVVAIGELAYNVRERDAWSHVAGVTLGQDISNREIQYWQPVPQYSLAKSYPGFGPIGPNLVTPDELPNPDDIDLLSTVNGRQVQSASTNDLIFDVPQLVRRISEIAPLFPGDLIFTGTMDGVGKASNPPTFLTEGDVLASRSSVLGEMVNRATFNTLAIAADQSLGVDR